jgi:hypothetical protein
MSSKHGPNEASLLGQIDFYGCAETIGELRLVHNDVLESQTTTKNRFFDGTGIYLMCDHNFFILSFILSPNSHYGSFPHRNMEPDIHPCMH